MLFSQRSAIQKDNTDLTLRTISTISAYNEVREYTNKYQRRCTHFWSTYLGNVEHVQGGYIGAGGGPTGAHQGTGGQQRLQHYERIAGSIKQGSGDGAARLHFILPQIHAEICACYVMQIGLRESLVENDNCAEKRACVVNRKRSSKRVGRR